MLNRYIVPDVMCDILPDVVPDIVPDMGSNIEVYLRLSPSSSRLQAVFKAGTTTISEIPMSGKLRYRSLPPMLATILTFDIVGH